ncbi:MAG TPA: isoprenylcysteine carboxylmethyltransferase family protein [Anaerolineaceae bacterium]|nr:isoprenylcysteine carboxylmethyltransferase family protein [Anaerolineaceae bacterium]HPN50411.1 isoprenylcysteine carboxylmethyltransferase family protein [Anaerolineaceae bacterium]
MIEQPSPDRKKQITGYLAREVLSLLGMAVALFWAAGRLDWLPGWGALAVMAGWEAATAILVIFIKPELLPERLNPKKDTPKWDVAIVSLLGLVTLFQYIAAGLDQRYGWSSGFAPAVQAAAFVLSAAGYAWFTWATYVNAFFSRTVRLQTDRGQAVVSGGPYRLMRHPAYLGALVYELAVSVMLASWPSFAFGVLAAALLILRTALEDRLLRADLPGYADYAARVRFRLFPGIW